MGALATQGITMRQFREMQAEFAIVMLCGEERTPTRVQKVAQPDVTELRTWSAHERISVTRATAGEGKR